jgi:arylsulfatase
MAELDWIVGELLAKVDELGIADNTIVMFTSDNGAEDLQLARWRQPSVPRRERHGVRRRLPGAHGGQVAWCHQAGHHHQRRHVGRRLDADARCGRWRAGSEREAACRLPGGREDLQEPPRRYNFKPFFEGKVTEAPRHEFFYFSDNADLMAVRYNEWKITFKTIVGNLFSGKEDSTNVPLVTNLRVDPWERYQTESTSYGEWWGKKLWVMMPAMTIMGQFLSTFKEFAPSQVSGSLSVEKALQALQEGGRKN